MALSDEQKNALANESRARAVETKLATVRGNLEVIGSISRLLSLQSSDAQIRMEALLTESSGLRNAAGPGLTDDFGERSIIDNAASTERNEGVTATLTAIRNNPSITVEQAIAAYTSAAMATRPSDRQWLLMSPQSLLNEYIANLVTRGSITEPTFAAMVQWVLTTPSDKVF
jgi:hypothetical protein